MWALYGLKHLWLDAGYEGRGKRWAEQVLGLSVEEVVVRKPPQAHTREGSADLGAGGMGQGGQEEGPLAKAYAAARVGGFAEEEVGGGADLLLAWPQQEDEQGLRALVRERRSVQRSSTWP